MKIHLPKHTVVESEHLNIKDIPLAYVNTENNVYHANIVLENDFKLGCRRQIRPYDKFDDPNICVLDKTDRMVELRLREHEGSYVFLPDNVLEFTPQNFYCDINLWHKMTFSNDYNFDIQISVDSYRADETLSARLLGIFGDAYKRGKCPPNILINHGSMLPESLFYDSEKSADFVFIESTADIKYKDSDTVIDLNSIVDAKRNIWLAIDNLGDDLYKSNSKTVEVYNPAVFNKNSYPYNGVEIPIFDSMLPITGFEYRDVFFIANSIIVLGKQNKGYIIISSAEILDEQNINALTPVIYETLIYVYTRSYKTVRSRTTWITDESVTYSAFQKNKLNANHGAINFDQLIFQNGLRLSDYYSILFIKCNNPNVIFTGMTNDGNMKFQKAGDDVDPVKTPNQISCLTAKGTVIIYEPTSQYDWIEDPIMITERISNSEIFIQINPCRNSRHRIYTTAAQELKIPDNRFRYVLCAKPVTPPLTSVFDLILESEYDKSLHGIKIAVISVNAKLNTELTDLRILGGGLPLNSSDDYNLIDIGNALGRPYSKNSVLIIRLPHKYAVYKDRIQHEIEKHISAGDYPILIFEKRTVI